MRIAILFHTGGALTVAKVDLEGEELDKVLECHGLFINGNCEDFPEYLTVRPGDEDAPLEEYLYNPGSFDIYYGLDNEIGPLDLSDCDQVVVSGWIEY